MSLRPFGSSSWMQRLLACFGPQRVSAAAVSVSSARRRAAGKWRRLLAFERLEGRDLFAVNIMGNTAVVTGTTAVDSFQLTFYNATAYSLYVNGSQISASTLAGVTNLAFDGLDGRDTLTVSSAPGTTDAVYATGQQLNWIGPIINVTSRNNELLYINGQAEDTVQFTDTTGDDNFNSVKAYSSMTGSGYFDQATGFGSIYAFRSNGGNDTSSLYDSTGNDTYYGLSGYSIMSSTGRFVQTIGFKNNFAYSNNGGTDTALLYDSTGDDTFTSRPNSAAMTSTGYSNTANGFRANYAFSSNGGNDVANLNDSSGDDTFNAFPTYSVMNTGNTFSQVIGFDLTKGFASGGVDTAFYYDSAVDDTFRGQQNGTSVMSSANYENDGIGFEFNYAFSSNGGNDVAFLYDTLGNDTFHAFPTYGILSGVGLFNQATGFKNLYAYGSAGVDTARFYANSGTNNFSGTATSGLMTGTNYANKAQGFDFIFANLDGSAIGTADLLDSSGNDTLTAINTQARIVYANGNQLYVYRFGTVNATRSTGTDQVSRNALTYVLNTYGGW